MRFVIVEQVSFTCYYASRILQSEMRGRSLGKAQGKSIRSKSRICVSYSKAHENPDSKLFGDIYELLLSSATRLVVASILTKFKQLQPISIPENPPSETNSTCLKICIVIRVHFMVLCLLYIFYKTMKNNIHGSFKKFYQVHPLSLFKWPLSCLI